MESHCALDLHGHGVNFSLTGHFSAGIYGVYSAHLPRIQIWILTVLSQISLIQISSSQISSSQISLSQIGFFFVFFQGFSAVSESVNTPGFLACP
jgi:hypothetical protein